MPNFLILKRTGLEPTDLDVVGVVDSKSKDTAIPDFDPKDEGQYIACPFDREEIDKQRVQMTPVLEPITPEDEQAEADRPPPPADPTSSATPEGAAVGLPLPPQSEPAVESEPEDDDVK